MGHHTDTLLDLCSDIAFRRRGIESLSPPEVAKLRTYRPVHFHRHQSVRAAEEEAEMRVDIFHHISPDPEVLARLDLILDRLDLVLLKENIIMSMETDALDQAEAAAAANSAADDSAEQLLITLSAMVADLKTHTSDPAVVARITALATAISDRAGKLGAAVVANTPAATA